MPLTVRHLDGPLEGQVQTFTDDIETILIGRDPDRCQIVLAPEARMAGREHCTLARVRGRYIVDMDASRRVTLDGTQLLDPGTPLPDSCTIQLGPDGPKLKVLATRRSGLDSTSDQQINQDELTRRESRPASEVDVAAVADTAGGSRRIGLAAGVLALIAGAVGLVFFFVTRSDVEELQVADANQEQAIGDLEDRSDEMEEDLVVLGADLPELMQEARASVYLVVIKRADGGETGIGTAFSVAPGQVATNSHVAKWLDDLDEGDAMVLRSAAMDGADPVDINVVASTHHPGYEAFADLWSDYVPVRLNASKGVDAVRSAGSACDLALLSVEDGAALGPALKVASTQHQALLMPGHAIAAVGYPMEGMAMDGVNVRQPVPQSQIGRVTALTTFFNTSEDESQAGPGQRNILLQHSIPGTGGASGSPIINGAGEVVGVLSAVNFAIVGGQRIPTGVGVNYAQRATLLEELLQETAADRLPGRLAHWDESVKFLYHSGKLVKGSPGIDTLRALWRRQVQEQVGRDNVVLVRNIDTQFFPLHSLEAGRDDSGGGGIVSGDDEGTDYDTSTELSVTNEFFYLLVAESDGTIELELDDPDGLAADINSISMGEGTQGVTFRATGDGTVTGVVHTTDATIVTWSLEEGESVSALPSNLLQLARDQWRDDLDNRWGAKVRDMGGLSSSASTTSAHPDGRFYEVETIELASYGRYMLAVIAPERSNLDVRLYQVDAEGNRTFLAEDMQDDWYPYLVIDTDYPTTLEADIIADQADVDYDVYVYRAVVAGDTDSDDRVNAADLVNVAFQFGQQSGEDGESLPSDIDQDGAVDVDDLTSVLANYNAEWPLEAKEQPKRLICMFTIGGSNAQGVAEINMFNFNLEDGWNAMVNRKLKPLVNELGPDAFDWWGHNIAGYWRDHAYYWHSEDHPCPMVFEQLEFARQTYPSLVDYSPLKTYCDANGIQMYGYLGQPRAYAREDTPCGQPFDLNWDHGAVSEFDRYYGEMADAGFIGVGFDASIHQPADSPWLVNIVPELERRGMDMFLESIPKRSHPHLLGHHVCAENRIWDIFGSQDSIWYTDDEIKAAGGRCMHMITLPAGMIPGGDDDPDNPEFNQHDWQFAKAKELLEAGEYVVVPMYGLLTRGYPLQELVDAARQTANVDVQ